MSSLWNWKETNEYHKTKDIMRVKHIPRHKNIHNSLIYINLENTLFQSENNDESYVRVAKMADVACKLLEVGSDYVRDIDDAKLFRKRK